MVESEMVPQNTNQGGGPSLQFLRTPSGVMMLVNFIMLMICWCILAAWRGNVDGIVAHLIISQTGYFLFCTVLPWLIYFVFFVILVLGCNEQFTNINWPRTFFFNCCLWGFLLFIASCVLASKSHPDNCEVWKCERLKAASAFGFLATIGLVIQAVLYYREFRSEGSGYAQAGAV